MPSQKHQFFTTYNETKNWLDQMEITKYTINKKTLQVDIDNNVQIENTYLKIIPVKFRYVTGNFCCDFNNLHTLLGAPDKVGGVFRCPHNNLTSLQGAPIYVEKDFFCASNQLTTLEGAPRYVGRNFSCIHNQLITLQHAPLYIGHDFFCTSNNLISLEGCPSNLKYNFICDGNNATLATINKYIKSANEITLLNVQPDLFKFMWVFLIKSVRMLNIYNASNEQHLVCKIINKYLRGTRSGPDCQIELIDAGLGKYIKL